MTPVTPRGQGLHLPREAFKNRDCFVGCGRGMGVVMSADGWTDGRLASVAVPGCPRKPPWNWLSWGQPMASALGLGKVGEGGR